MSDFQQDTLDFLRSRPDLVKPRYKPEEGSLRGHCYVACEALWHMFYKDYGYLPYNTKVDGESHWFLKSKDFGLVDPTSEQFGNRDLTPEYENAKQVPFLTREPSKRTRVVLEHMRYM